MRHKKATKTANVTPTHKYRVGMRVMVIEPGYTYPSFSTMFKKHGLRNTTENRPFLRGTTATITAVDMHPSPVSKKDTLLYVLAGKNSDGERIECVVGETAITEAIPGYASDIVPVTFHECHVDSSLCRWDRENSVLHVSGQGLSVRNAVRGFTITGLAAVLRVHNTETDGYGDFMYIGSTAQSARFKGLGNSLEMVFHWE